MRRSTGYLIVAVLLGLLWTSRSGSSDAAVDVSPSVDLGATSPTVVAPDTVLFDAGRCADSGYLCEGLAAEGESRAIRWPDDTGTLSVRVPLPPDVDRGVASELQRQAAAGIREWQGRPLPLTVVSTAESGPVDVEVRWVRSLTDDRVGQAAVRWRVGPEGAELAVLDFVLATHTPKGAPLDPHRLRLTAAHEMGHVLGLPHSDLAADVMYAYNTATRLTFRDFRTLEVLYSLPAGALVQLR